MTLTTAKRLMALFLCTTLLFAGLFAWQLSGGALPEFSLPWEEEDPWADDGEEEDPWADDEEEGPDRSVLALENQPRENYTDEMKIPAGVVLDQGTKDRERMGDHQGSPYFCNIDFYNAKPTETLLLLPNFRTYQQTSQDTCGPACVVMVLDYYGKLGDWNEQSLAELATSHADVHGGLCLDQMMEIFQKVGGFELKTTYDYGKRVNSINELMLQTNVEKGIPTIIGWNDRGGHWQVVIGYDSMGTVDPWDDVVILADPSDDTDHNQDGYYVYSMQRLLTNFAFYGMTGVEDHVYRRCFLAPQPAE